MFYTVVHSGTVPTVYTKCGFAISMRVWLCNMLYTHLYFPRKVVSECRTIAGSAIPRHFVTLDGYSNNKGATGTLSGNLVATDGVGARITKRRSG